MMRKRILLTCYIQVTLRPHHRMTELVMFYCHRRSICTGQCMVGTQLCNYTCLRYTLFSGNGRRQSSKFQVGLSAG